MLEVKHWLGMVAMGIAAILCAAAMNDPADLAWRESSIVPPDASANDMISGKAIDLPKTPDRPVKRVVRKPATKTATDSASDKPVRTAPEPRKAVVEPRRTSSPGAGPKGRHIRGMVTYAGKKKTPALIDMSADGVCLSRAGDKKIYKESYAISDGKLAHVVVYIADKSLPRKAWPVRSEKILIDQVGCAYIPHVVAMQVGQEVTIRNSDPTTHNVHLVSRKNGGWNKSQPKQGETMGMVQPFKRGEVGTSSFKCDMHPWMECKTYVFDHPFFALTARDGTFSIDCTSLPDGEYTVMAFHEKFKTKYNEGDKKGRIKIKLTADGADQNIEFTGKKKKK